MVNETKDATRIFFRNRPQTPLGRIQIAGYVQNTWRCYTWPMRQLGTYAMVYVTEGGGRYRDAQGVDLTIQAGDLIVLFPEKPHTYGPKPGGQWSEIYAHIDGPLFHLWREVGMLDPDKPVYRHEDILRWRTELETVLENSAGDDKTDQVIQLARFAALLTQMMTTGIAVDRSDDLPNWLQTALALMDTDLANNSSLSEIAEEAGFPYNTFRKHFEMATGLSPLRYRFLRRMEAACSMLSHTKMKIREIAEALGFNDEFHFSNRFQTHTGSRPGAYRHETRMRPEGTSEKNLSAPNKNPSP